MEQRDVRPFERWIGQIDYPMYIVTVAARLGRAAKSAPASGPSDDGRRDAP